VGTLITRVDKSAVYHILEGWGVGESDYVTDDDRDPTEQIWPNDLDEIPDSVVQALFCKLMYGIPTDTPLHDMFELVEKSVVSESSSAGNNVIETPYRLFIAYTLFPAIHDVVCGLFPDYCHEEIASDEHAYIIKLSKAG